MRVIYSKIPEAALFREFDGHLYARVPHRYNALTNTITENFDTPMLRRFTAECFIRHGIAFIRIGAIGDAVKLPPLWSGVEVLPAAEKLDKPIYADYLPRSADFIDQVRATLGDFQANRLQADIAQFIHDTIKPLAMLSGQELRLFDEKIVACLREKSANFAHLLNDLG